METALTSVGLQFSFLPSFFNQLWWVSNIIGGTGCRHWQRLKDVSNSLTPPALDPDIYLGIKSHVGMWAPSGDGWGTSAGNRQENVENTNWGSFMIWALLSLTWNILHPLTWYCSAPTVMWYQQFFSEPGSPPISPAHKSKSGTDFYLNSILLYPPSQNKFLKSLTPIPSSSLTSCPLLV